MTKVAVVIPSLYHVDGEYLKLAVESLRATTDWPIYVVTNGTGHKPDLKHIKGISAHIHTPKQGQCVASNIGAQIVPPDTDYIMVSNSDMFYASGWNKNLRFDYPCFSPNLIEPTDNAGSAPPFVKAKGGLTLDTFDQGIVDSVTMIETVGNKGKEEPGFNLPFFIKRDLWNLLGGYDTAFDPWGSNSDTCLQTRINLAGVTPMRLRDMAVYHFSNKSGTFSSENDAFRMNNFEYFKDKFGFDRDSVEGCDVWYNKNMLPTDESKIKYKQAKYEA